MKVYFTNKISKLKTYIYLLFITLSVSNTIAVYAQQVSDYSSLVERILPSVVTIRTVTNEFAQIDEPIDECDCDELNALDQSATNELLQQLMFANSENSGSGFVFSEDGYIVTNAHVLTAASRVLVGMQDGRQFEAEIMGLDELSDLALLKISAEGLTPVKLASSNIELKAGQVVLGIGSPFSFTQSVTARIISYVERALPEQGRENNYVSYIQTDMLINPGNSGGPIINTKGEVIGVSSRIFSTTGVSIGISFAVPVEVINYVIPQLLNGNVSRGWIGASTENIDLNLLQDLGVIGPIGAIIEFIHPDSPAEKSGLRVNDVVVTVDGHVINNSEEFIFHEGLLKPNAVTELTVIRNGRYYATELVSGRIQF